MSIGVPLRGEQQLCRWLPEAQSASATNPLASSMNAEANMSLLRMRGFILSSTQQEAMVDTLPRFQE
jgi:hypothetical protein